MSEDLRPVPGRPLRRRIPSSWSALPRLPALGDTFAHHYRILKRLGRGGFGTVYQAFHTSSRMLVAIKILNPSVHLDELHVERFRREALLAASLHHPNTIRVFDYGCTALGLSYIVMEHLQGLPLDRVLAQFGPRSATTAAHIIAQVLLSLNEAHSLHLIHRDLKPANLFALQPTDDLPTVKVLDFGVARDLTAPGRLTDHEDLCGTLAYTSPEQIAETSLTAASDLYSVGLVLYELIAARSPYSGWSEMDIIAHKLNGRPLIPAPDLNPEAARLLLPIIARATSSDHRARYPNAIAFLQAIEQSGLLLAPLLAESTVVRAEPGDLEGLLLQARDHAQSHRHREAQRLLRQLVTCLAEPSARGEHVELLQETRLLQAEVARHLGHFGAAEDALRSTLAALPPDHLLRVNAHLAFAEVLLDTHQFEEAGVQFLAAITRDPGDSPGSAGGNLGLSRIAQHNQDTEEAIDFARDALAIATRRQDLPLQQRATLRLAESLDAGERSAEAASQARALLALQPPSNLQLAARRLLALDAAKRGDGEELERELQQLLLTEGATAEVWPLLLWEISRAATLRKRSTLALSVARRALAFVLQHELDHLEEPARMEIARAHLDSKLPGTREDTLEHAALIAQHAGRSGDPIAQAEALNSAAGLLLCSGEAAQAEALLQKSLLLQQRGGLWRPRAQTHILRALHIEPEDPWQAHEEAACAVEAASQFEAPEQMAYARLLLGRLSLQLEQPGQARAMFEEVRILTEEHRMKPLELTAIAALATLHRFLDRPDEEQQQRRALELALANRPSLSADVIWHIQRLFPQDRVSEPLRRAALSVLEALEVWAQD